VLCAATQGVLAVAKISQGPSPLVVPPGLELLEWPKELLPELEALRLLDELLPPELELLEWTEELPLFDELPPPPVIVSDVSVGLPLPLAQNPKVAVPPLAAIAALYDSGVTVTLFPLVA
jgi:hypothetical protein